MSDFVPDGFLTTHQAVDVVGRHLSPNDWTGEEIELFKPQDADTGEAKESKRDQAQSALRQRLDLAIHHLQSQSALSKVKAVVVCDDGTSYLLKSSVWLSNCAPTIFRAGVVPVSLPQGIADRQSGKGRRRVLFPKVALNDALTHEGKPEVERPAIAADDAGPRKDDELGLRIAAVLEEGRRRLKGKKPPSMEQIADWMVSEGKAQDYKSGTVRKILEGRYPEAKSRGFGGIGTPGTSGTSGTSVENTN